MFVPSLNLDGTLKKRSTMQDRLDKEGQPGVYSPRVPSKTNTSERSAGQSDSPSLRSRSSSEEGSTSGLAPPVNADSPTASTTSSEHATEKTVPVADPELERKRSTHSSGASAPSAAPTTPLGGSSSAAARGRSPSALTTLVEHQQAREKSPSVSRGATPEAEPITDARATGQTSVSTATPARSAASHPTPVRQPLGFHHIQVEGAYVVGRPLKDYVSLLNQRLASQKNRKSAAAAPSPASPSPATNTTTAVFRQNPMQYVSSMAVSGDLVAIGDRAGRVCVMRRQTLTATQRAEVAQLEEIESGCDEDEGTTANPAATTSSKAAASNRFGSRCTASFKSHPHAQDPYEFHTSKQAYVSVIDPLNSVDVLPNVTALAFLPQRSPASFLLTANEKVPKLYKMMSVRESAKPFHAVDKIDVKTIGPLTASSRSSTVVMKPIVRYALNHEYNINSICPFSDCEQFVTADDLSVQLWCTEYPETSIETYDLRPPSDEDAREVIRGVRCFPHEPFLLFVMTSAGNVRVVDVRQSMRWMDQTPQIFTNPQRAADGDYSHVTNSLCDAALSPCGRYIAGRDFMSVCLWDVRMAGSSQAARSGAGPSSPRRGGGGLASSGSDGLKTEHGAVRSWCLHPHLRSRLENLYQSDLLFDRFDVAFLTAKTITTGGLNSVLYTIDVTRDAVDGGLDGGSEPDATSAATASPGVQAFQLPTMEGITDMPRTIVRPCRASTVPSGEASTTELGSRVTLLSRPTMSVGGACGMLASCGQAVLQFSYNGLL